MTIVADNEIGIGYDGTVDKLVVVGVGFDKVEMKLRIETQHERTTENGTYNVCGKRGVDFLSKNLHIFTDNLIAYTKGILSVEERFPRQAIFAAQGYHAEQAVGINHNVPHAVTVAVVR